MQSQQQNQAGKKSRDSIRSRFYVHWISKLFPPEIREQIKLEKKQLKANINERIKEAVQTSNIHNIYSIYFELKSLSMLYGLRRGSKLLEFYVSSIALFFFDDEFPLFERSAVAMNIANGRVDHVKLKNLILNSEEIIEAFPTEKGKQVKKEYNLSLDHNSFLMTSWNALSRLRKCHGPKASELVKEKLFTTDLLFRVNTQLTQNVYMKQLLRVNKNTPRQDVLDILGLLWSWSEVNELYQSFFFFFLKATCRLPQLKDFDFEPFFSKLIKNIQLEAMKTLSGTRTNNIAGSSPSGEMSFFHLEASILSKFILPKSYPKSDKCKFPFLPF